MTQETRPVHWHGDCPNGGGCPDCYLNDGHRVSCGYNPFSGRPCKCDKPGSWKHEYPLKPEGGIKTMRGIWGDGE